MQVSLNVLPCVPVGVLDVLHCVLVDSPEALNVIKEQHIRTIISLIDKHGRDPKVPYYPSPCASMIGIL